VSNFVVETTSSTLDEIHALYTAVIGKKITRGGQNTVRNPKPFAIYDLVFEDKYRRHQIMREYDDYLGHPSVSYKQPHRYRFQYTLVFDSNDKSCAAMIQNLSRYMVQDNFKLAMDRLNVGFHMVSDITEVCVPIEGFTDRQFIFQIDYFWADTWTDSTDNATAGFIETVNKTQVAPPSGG